MDPKKKLTELLKNKYPKNVYVDIFSIIKEEDYITNNNGIFFDLNKVAEDKILKCVQYIECIQYNIEDHLEQLNIRETIEDNFKKSLLVKPVKKQEKAHKKQKVEKAIKNPFEKKTYKGVYNRLDRVLRGVKKEEKIVKKVKKDQEEEQDMKEFEEGCDSISESEEEEEVIIEDEDLFGEETDGEDFTV